MCTKEAIEHLNSNPRAISLSTLTYSFTLQVIGTTEWSAKVKLCTSQFEVATYSLPSHSGQPTLIRLLLMPGRWGICQFCLDAVGIQLKVSSLSSGINVFYLQVNMEVFTSAFKQLRINEVYKILV